MMRVLLFIFLAVFFISQNIETYALKEIKRKFIKDMKKVFSREAIIEAGVIATCSIFLLSTIKALYNLYKGNVWSYDLERFLTITAAPAISITCANRIFDRYNQKRQERKAKKFQKRLDEAIQKVKEEQQGTNQ